MRTLNWNCNLLKKKKKIEINNKKTSKTIDREHSLSTEGVGRNKTITESVRGLENGPKYSCVS